MLLNYAAAARHPELRHSADSNPPALHSCHLSVVEHFPTIIEDLWLQNHFSLAISTILTFFFPYMFLVWAPDSTMRVNLQISWRLQLLNTKYFYFTF